MFRTVCGGKGGGGSSYDPQVGQAAAANSAVAERAQAFSEQYYNDVVTPLLRDQTGLAHTLVDQEATLGNRQLDMQQKVSDRQLSLAESQQELAKRAADAGLDTQGKLNTLYDLNADQMRQANDRYNKFGVPAEESYYKMVRDFSSSGEEERQARLAKGDVGTAAANQRGAFMRSLSGLGISASSPAVVSAMSDQAVANAALEAGAATRARGAAKALGMTLTSDAANYGRGGTSSTLAFGNAAQGNTAGASGAVNGALAGNSNALSSLNGTLSGTTGAFGAAANALGSSSSGIYGGYASGMSGFGTAANAYGSNLDAYSRMGSADIQSKAANDPMAGIGKLAGTLGSAAISAGMFSDRRLKEHLFPHSKLSSGIPVYVFNYIGDKVRQIGVMAQDVMQKIPSAVSVDPDSGMYKVNYAELH